MPTLLDISDLTLRYMVGNQQFTALDSVNLTMAENEFLAVVGESGCGKSSLGLSIIGLTPKKSSRIVKGSIRYKDEDLARLHQDELREYRGTEIAMIFQEPLTSLNPVYKIGDQMAEAIEVRTKRKSGVRANNELAQKVYDAASGDQGSLSRALLIRRGTRPEVKKEMVDWLDLVRIGDPEHVLELFPFELSGGMRQRVMIAMALSQKPALLIADEPTTALDVTTQAQVLKLMRDLMHEVNTSILLITHDLAVASQVADRVVVMYAGEIAEDAEVNALFKKPLHPYTQGLLNCIPAGTKDNSFLAPIPRLRPLFQ